MTSAKIGDTAVYFAPVRKQYFQKWEYYQVDLDMLNTCFSNVIVCHSNWSFIKTIIFSRVSAVYGWWWHQAVICVILSRICRIPVYITGAVHMYDESGSQDFTSKGFLYRTACRFAWRFASVNLFISKSQFRQICSHEKVNNAHLLKSSLPKSYEMPLLNVPLEVRSNKGTSNIRKIRLLTIVWMTRDQLKRKSVYETLGALKLLLDKGITNFEWTIAGGDSDGREELLIKIFELGLEPYVKIVCDVSQEKKAILYENADLYVQPSYYEGFGNAVLEAMSYGLLAVVSRNTAQAEVIGDSGFMVEEIDSDSIAKVLTEYLALSSEEYLDRRELVYKMINERHLFEFRLDQFVKIINSEEK